MSVLTAAVPLLCPLEFDPEQWPEEPKAPSHYTQPVFTVADVNALVQRGPNYDTIVILGVTMTTMNTQLDLPAGEPNYPVYFEITGQRWHYSFSIWQNRLMIEVSLPGSFETVQYWFPYTRTHLEAALSTIVADYR